MGGVVLLPQRPQRKGPIGGWVERGREGVCHDRTHSLAFQLADEDTVQLETGPYIDLRHERQLPIMPAMARKYCYHCYYPQQNCFCPFIKPFDTFTHFAFLMHPKEARKQKTGTGRLTQLCLNNSQLFIGEDFSGNQGVNCLLEDSSYYPLILFPGKNATNISQEQIILPEGKTPCVFVIDGTWRSAKKILRLSHNLKKWPQIRFTPKKSSQFLIKKEPDIDCVSTIESVFYYLKEAEKLEWEDCCHQDAVLLEILAKLVNFQLKFIRKKPDSRRLL